MNCTPCYPACPESAITLEMALRTNPRKIDLKTPGVGAPTSLELGDRESFALIPIGVEYSAYHHRHVPRNHRGHCLFVVVLCRGPFVLEDICAGFLVSGTSELQVHWPSTLVESKSGYGFTLTVQNKQHGCRVTWVIRVIICPRVTAPKERPERSLLWVKIARSLPHKQSSPPKIDE